jgi:DNA-binding transcriptional ArsR family regulator
MSAPCLASRFSGILGPVSGIKCMAVLKALGEMNRLRMVRLLLKERLGVNEITRRLAMPQYNVSKHLRVLRDAGLLDVEKNGKQRLYGVASELKRHLAENDNVLELDCCTFRFDKLPR